MVHTDTTVLVLGAHGFVGRAVTRALCEYKRYKVVGLGREQADVCDREEVW